MEKLHRRFSDEQAKVLCPLEEDIAMTQQERLGKFGRITI